MKNLIVLVATALLSACAWNPVLTPYAVKSTKGLSPDQLATVWGTQEDAQIFFTRVNGKTLPSRRGGGHPASLTLDPGTHKISVYFFDRISHRWASLDVLARVEPGHTYVVEPLLVSGGTGLQLRLKDLGTTAQCRLERYDSFRGHARLVCEPPIGA